jgi:hypothetical protein
MSSPNLSLREKFRAQWHVEPKQPIGLIFDFCSRCREYRDYTGQSADRFSIELRPRRQLQRARPKPQATTQRHRLGLIMFIKWTLMNTLPLADVGISLSCAAAR